MLNKTLLTSLLFLCASLTVNADPIEISAIDLKDAQKENKLRFNRDYKGKTLTVYGELSSVIHYDHKGMLDLELVATTAAPNIRALSSFIVCQIPDSSRSFEKAFDLKVGDTVRVTGDFNDYDFLHRIALSDCSIL